MYNQYAKQQLPVLKTEGEVIRSKGVPIWQPPACHFHHFKNQIFPLENLVKICIQPILMKPEYISQIFKKLTKTL